MLNAHTTMRCAEMKDLLDSYVDEELPEEVRARIDRHLLRCADCAFQVRTLEQTRVLLRDAYAPVEPSPAFREKMTARLQDAFADVLRPEPEAAVHQRTLPLLPDTIP
jgi:anti-sigma factor RsiW